MATSAIVTPIPTSPTVAGGDWVGLALAAATPLALFGLANVMAEPLGGMPLFFAPFGLPGWVGGALHLLGLPLYGAAARMVARQGAEGHIAARWIVALTLGTIAFPFIVAPLDSLVLAMVTMALLALGLATLGRVVKVSPRAGLLMAPGLVWIGTSALVGLAYTAGWTPPFAPLNAVQTA
ncbi:MAG TPA: tryptophan-rich sensory protein [Devosia sp.]|nr:tryptophan-rich sensory protein [Devosia sp.]